MLSFGDEEEEENEQSDEEEPAPSKKKKKFGKDPSVDTSFLPDQEREVRFAALAASCFDVVYLLELSVVRSMTDLLPVLL